MNCINCFKDEKLLLKIVLGISAVWIVAQIALIAYFWGHPQISDMGAYITMAWRCFKNEQWYPMASDVYSAFIWAPGYINYLILQLNVFGTLNFNAVLNLFLNIAILLEVYYLGKKFFSKRTGLISVIIFCLFYSNLFIVLGANTENPFLFLCLSALCLVFSGKWKYVIGAALLFALANWIRPLAIIFLFASVIYFFLTKAKFYNYIALIIPYILIILIIGTITENKIGYFVYQSTTSGYNLIMTSHDKANGYYQYVFSEGKAGFIENKKTVPFVKKDSIWKARSFKWIKEHPLRYVGLFFKKIPILYVNNNWGDVSHRRSEAELVNGKSKFSKVAYLLSVPYYLTILLFFYSLWINRKEILSVKSVFLVILITGTIITCLFPAMPRYHYPFIFTVILYAAWGLDVKTSTP